MAKKLSKPSRREDSLSRERIIEAAVELLDKSGEAGLTFRSLAERLATGPGALYWHIDNKTELLTAACNAVVERTLNLSSSVTTPEATIREVALGLFDAISSHPWVGSALTRAPGQLPIVRIIERIGQQVRALGVPDAERWTAATALLNYIIGVGGQNAANGQLAQTRGINRTDFMNHMSGEWSKLDASEFPFTRSVASQLRDHDDRADFLAGIDFILRGIGAVAE